MKQQHCTICLKATTLDCGRHSDSSGDQMSSTPLPEPMEVMGTETFHRGAKGEVHDVPKAVPEKDEIQYQEDIKAGVAMSEFPEKEGWEKEFDNMFDWAEQIKESELLRWKMMYGFFPNDLKSFIKSLLAQAKEEERQAWLTGYRCIGCGVEQDNQLSDMCAKCFEEA